MSSAENETRRNFLKLTAGAAGLVTALKSAKTQAAVTAQGKPSPWAGGKPNFLIILAGEERFPPGYENTEIPAWRRASPPARGVPRDPGVGSPGLPTPPPRDTS